ncbi:pyruvate:ferredoxin (flavodoxin) oxidoreductase [Heliophilum fasciatum]|uniref:Pyruvate:ferredoxin oxidoreductase n=1 Tax=Heliophilum fasciatum TaxID=35700 RepID=A0A4R2RZF3_9FIRM|nr:pyruvate:ferredoxin (flavodoxin) oxidoreductase [Heliophilum fasciatum]MCW2276975.1 pyruvate-ferredoxin/flavodoxin oxidoreductase [Heliophilum fasciatum]TCP68499.1 pyruvate-ferredoxin/flavodoxin oxidoreductase [Heliophilum fasciatum]
MAKAMKTMDGNKAAAYVSYAFTECAAIYPITPSSPMAEYTDEWSAQGQKNIFGQTVKLAELQSEAGAAAAVHGSLQAGALTTTYTASQGLLLMIPNMYKIAGELLPGVMHVTARAVAGHALSIFGDHSDVMAVRQTGWAMLASGSVQEVMDLGGVAHLAALKSRVPFVHFFDGFRTSHEMQKIETIDYDDLAKLVDQEALSAFRARSLNPERPVVRGTAQNPDIFFQAKESANRYYEAVPEVVLSYMQEISKLTGRSYRPFDYYGAPDAERIIVAMGSVNEVIEETINALVAAGEKVGLIKVRLYRPFSAKHFFDVLPQTVKKIAVLDRTKEPGALGEPLLLDVRAMFYESDRKPVIVGGRYGLGSKDVVPADINAVFENLKADQPKSGFTISIVDDLTFKSLAPQPLGDTTPKGTIQCKFWGLGSDGTVGANKSAVEIIGTYTPMYAQAYFAYDSKKSGGVTISHLRFGHQPIKSPYLIKTADFVSCSNQAYCYTYDLLEGLKPGGTFLLNTVWKPEELEEKLPPAMKAYLAQNNIKVFIIDAVSIAENLGLGNRTNMVMQAAFFKLAKVIPIEEAVGYMKDGIQKTYGRKGEKIVAMNCAAVDAGVNSLVAVEVPASWAGAVVEAAATVDEPAYVTNIQRPVNRQQGDKLPVSAFAELADGTMPVATSKYEKRGVASQVPEFLIDNCIQCNRCSYVCPHAAIRPFLVNSEEAAKAPEAFAMKKAVGKQLEGLQFRVQVSPMDCMGCGSCAQVCPSKTKALVMRDFGSQVEAQTGNWNFATTLSIKDNLLSKDTVKGSQFAQPLFEFSGACAGCGETPYIKLITQLYGDRMMIANATGCTSIYGASAPTVPYCTNSEGKGPAWANSLFEDPAEFGYGMLMGVNQLRDKLAGLVAEAVQAGVTPELAEAFNEWLAGKDDGDASKAATAKILPLLAASNDAALQPIVELKDHFIKKSQWIIGGDGWAYDIGYGGLDHVLASGEDVNIIVLDTEVYSNTGGQSSKATPAAAIAKFAAAGKRTKKKDLGMMAMSYGYVYVAQIAMGADYNQTLQAIREAEAYKGPSLIIAYSSCISHGLKSGMNNSQTEMEKAVKSGYWHLYRFNPDRKEQGLNPFVLDSKEPTAPFKDFLLGEVRYASLQQLFPDVAAEFFVKAENDAKERYETYKRLAN